MERSFLQFPVKRNYNGHVFSKVMHKDVTATLVVHNETDSPERFDDFSAGKGLAHNLTSISLRATPGFDFI